MIMRATISKGKSVEEICSETGVATSTAYREIREVTEGGPIFIARVILTNEGKKIQGRLLVGGSTMRLEGFHRGKRPQCQCS
jgi:hypothetical protein